MYLSDKKWTLPSSVVVLKIWTFKNHHFSTISNQVNPTLKKKSGQSLVEILEMVQNVQQIIKEHPSTSIRRLRQQVKLC
jgi:hypothetical protein